MYLRHFGLTESPFTIAPNPRFLYMSGQHHEALAHLVYGVTSSGGFIVLTGEVGTGKTTVCRCFLEQLPDQCDVAFIFNPKLNVVELLSSVCDELKIQKRGTTQKDLIDSLNRYLLNAHSRGRKTLLIIDEAQNLSASVLEQLRLLTNLETNDAKLLQIVLLGQPELKELFARKELRQLAQRITARYHLNHLSRKETEAYIEHRLTVAGRSKRLFSQKAINLIHKLSGGIPRLINLLCDRSLLGAYSNGKRWVARPTVVGAAKEIFGDAHPFKRLTDRLNQKPVKVFSIATVSTALLAVGLWFFSSHVFNQVNQANRSDSTLSTLPLETLATQEYSSAAGQPLAQTGAQNPNNLGQNNIGFGASAEQDALMFSIESSETLSTTPSTSTANANLFNFFESAPDSVNTGVTPSVMQTGRVQRSTTSKSEHSDWVGGEPTLGYPSQFELESARKAYSRLLSIWGISVEKAMETIETWTADDFCNYVQSQEVGCFTRENSIDSLAKLNRPAVVTLVYNQADPSLASSSSSTGATSGAADEMVIIGTLIRLNGKEAIIEINGRQARFTRSALAQLWGGEYTVLWKRPPVYHGDIVVGTIGPEIRWLSQRLGELEKDSELSQGILHYDEAFREKVKAFQERHGLSPDGIVGAQTWITINTALGESVPILARTADLQDEG